MTAATNRPTRPYFSTVNVVLTHADGHDAEVYPFTYNTPAPHGPRAAEWAAMQHAYTLQRVRFGWRRVSAAFHVASWEDHAE